MKSLLRSTVLAAVLGTALGGLPAMGDPAVPTFDDIVAAAKKEGKLNAWIFYPAKPETQRAVINAFNARFGLNTEVTWVATSPVTALTTAIAESKGGRVTVDIIAGSEEEVAGAVNSGIVKSFPWSQVFAGQFPLVAALEASVIKAYEGKALPYMAYHYGIAWNPNSIADGEVPSKFVDLADPKWKGRFGFNSIFMNPAPMIAPVTGSPAAIDLSRKIFANKPVFARGTPAVAQAVVNGTVPIGVTGFPVAEAGIRKGEPLRFKLFDDYIPVAMENLVVLENAPHPNMARLFSAWFAGEGYAIADKYEPMPVPADLKSKISQMVVERVAAGAILAATADPKDLETTAKVRDAVSLMMSGQN
ncbi:extracellular solute-binding protein [Xanthobacter sp. KR7-225]|uniref:ABC transporter substrate-binding protein n=1 Tax=Xanthobacter sp. KR7-225 TaxID=3156613 RepID=UPI0032B45286